MKSDGNGPLESELPAKGLCGQLFAATPNLIASCADKKSCPPRFVRAWGARVTPAALKSNGMVKQMPDHPLGFCQNVLCLNELLKRDEQEDGLARA